jgi:hypothetical protein
VSGGPAREVETAWRQIVDEVTRVRPLLGRLLADAVVLSEEDGRLSVAVPNGSAFAQDQIRSRDNRQLLIETAQRLRPGTRDIVVTAGQARPGPGPAVTEHPAVQAAMTLFEGEVLAVQPAEPRDRRTTSGEGT